MSLRLVVSNPPRSFGNEPNATALFRDTGNTCELQLMINRDTGYLSATLLGKNVDAFGNGQASLVTNSLGATTLAANVVLEGYDVGADQFCEFEVGVGATWSKNGPDGSELEGTAVLTDLSSDSQIMLQTVPLHPFNRLNNEPKSTTTAFHRSSAKRPTITQRITPPNRLGERAAAKDAAAGPHSRTPFVYHRSVL